MAHAAGSRFSPFNLFFDDVQDQVKGDRDEAMKWWNRLGQLDRREYQRRSEYLKEAAKKACRPQESKVSIDVALENYQRLEQISRSSDMLRKSMKLLCVQYSAHHKAAVADGGKQETRYFPNEISVIQFSFVGGIEDEAHSFVLIPDEDVPSYCKAEMKDRFEELHHIPYDDDDIRRSKLAPIEPRASNLLTKMFGSRRDEEMMTFCLSEDREVLLGSIKTLVNYVPDPEDAQEFLKRASRAYDFEDLLPLLSPRPEETRDMLARSFKDRLADDVQCATRCRCDFHRGLEETEVHCTLLRGHSALHLAFDSSAQDLGFVLTRRHVNVEEKAMDRCSAGYYAAHPDKASEEDQLIWSKQEDAESVAEGTEFSPKNEQLKFLLSLRDPEFAGESHDDTSASEPPRVERPRGDDDRLQDLDEWQKLSTSEWSIVAGSAQHQRPQSRGGRGRGYAVESEVLSLSVPHASGFGRGRQMTY